MGLGVREGPLLKSRDHVDDDSIPGVMGLYIFPRLETKTAYYEKNK